MHRPLSKVDSRSNTSVPRMKMKTTMLMRMMRMSVKTTMMIVMTTMRITMKMIGMIQAHPKKMVSTLMRMRTKTKPIRRRRKISLKRPMKQRRNPRS